MFTFKSPNPQFGQRLDDCDHDGFYDYEEYYADDYDCDGDCSEASCLKDGTSDMSRG